MRKRHLTLSSYSRIINAIHSENAIVWAKLGRNSYLCNLQSSKIEELKHDVIYRNKSWKFEI